MTASIIRAPQDAVLYQGRSLSNLRKIRWHERRRRYSQHVLTRLTLIASGRLLKRRARMRTHLASKSLAFSECLVVLQIKRVSRREKGEEAVEDGHAASNSELDPSRTHRNRRW